MPVGGAEEITRLLMREGGDGIQAVCLREAGVLGEEIRRAGYVLHELGWLKRKQFSPVVAWKLARWLKAGGFNWVHSHVYNAHVYAVLAGWLAGIPVLMHHHKTFSRARWRRYWTMRLLARRARQHVVLSEQMAEDVASELRVERGRITVLSNAAILEGVPEERDKAALRRQLGLPTDVAMAGTAASLTPQKNHGATLRVAARLAGGGFPVRFQIYGEGVMRAELEAQRKVLGVEAWVDMPGNKRPLAPWLAALDVFVLPSTWEGEPLALLQALALGLPVVASRIEGNISILGEDHPGLFDCADEERYAERIRRVLEDKEWKEKILAKQSELLRQRSTAADYACHMFELYAQTVASPRSA